MKVRALPDHPCAGAPRRRDTFSHPILFYIGYFGSIAHFFFFFLSIGSAVGALFCHTEVKNSCI